MRFEIDLWDVGAMLALLAVFVGLFVWYWPAALVAMGVSYLSVYFYRETRLAPQPIADRTQPDAARRDA